MEPERFESRFRDHYTRREWQITQAPVEYEDITFFYDTLLLLSPEMRHYVVSQAALIIKAAELLEVP